jgi:hypothetical protein
MAYIRPEDEQGSPFGGESAATSVSNPVISGDVGGQNIGGAAPQQKSAAPKSSWYNIQNFLSANQPGAAASREAIGAQAKNVIGQESAATAKAAGDINAAPIKTAQAFDPGKVGEYSEEQISSGLGQNYTPVDYSKYNISPPSSVQNIASSSGAGDIYSAFGGQPQQTKKPMTVGQRQMEAALLGSGEEGAKWTNEFIPQFKEQYKSQVTDPYYKAIEDRKAQEAQAAADIEAAKGSWNTGLTDWTGAQQQAIQDKLTEMQGAQAPGLNEMAPEYTSGSAGAYGAGGQSFQQYLAAHPELAPKYDAAAPTRANAAYSALGGMEGVNKYNKIASFLKNTPMETASELRGGEVRGLDAAKAAYENDALISANKNIAAGLKGTGKEKNEAFAEYDSQLSELNALKQQQANYQTGGSSAIGVQKTPYDKQIIKLAKKVAASKQKVTDLENTRKKYAKSQAKVNPQPAKKKKKGKK